MSVKTLAAGAVVAAALLAPSTASADHIAELPGDQCIIGAFYSGVGINLFTTDFTVKNFKDGRLEYTCRFDVPAYVPENYEGVEQYRPKKFTSQPECWYGEWMEIGSRIGSGVYRISPNGSGELRCRFSADSTFEPF